VVHIAPDTVPELRNVRGWILVGINGREVLHEDEAAVLRRIAGEDRPLTLSFRRRDASPIEGLHAPNTTRPKRMSVMLPLPVASPPGGPDRQASPVAAKAFSLWEGHGGALGSPQLLDELNHGLHTAQEALLASPRSKRGPLQSKCKDLEGTILVRMVLFFAFATWITVPLDAHKLTPFTV